MYGRGLVVDEQKLRGVVESIFLISKDSFARRQTSCICKTPFHVIRIEIWREKRLVAENDVGIHDLEVKPKLTLTSRFQGAFMNQALDHCKSFHLCRSLFFSLMKGYLSTYYISGSARSGTRLVFCALRHYLAVARRRSRAKAPTTTTSMNSIPFSILVDHSWGKAILRQGQAIAERHFSEQ